MQSEIIKYFQGHCRKAADKALERRGRIEREERKTISLEYWDKIDGCDPLHKDVAQLELLFEVRRVSLERPEFALCVGGSRKGRKGR